MKYAIAATMMAFGLAACGGGGGGDAKAKLVEACVEEEGSSKEACECQVTALEDALGSDTLNKLADLADKEDEAAAEALMMEVMTENPEAMGKMGAAMMSCAG